MPVVNLPRDRRFRVHDDQLAEARRSPHMRSVHRRTALASYRALMNTVRFEKQTASLIDTFVVPGARRVSPGRSVIEDLFDREDFLA
jgi:hypothetical protein